MPKLAFVAQPRIRLPDARFKQCPGIKPAEFFAAADISLRLHFNGPLIHGDGSIRNSFAYAGNRDIFSSHETTPKAWRGLRPQPIESRDAKTVFSFTQEHMQQKN